jgi:hypothetical protein
MSSSRLNSSTDRSRKSCRGNMKRRNKRNINNFNKKRPSRKLTRI